MSKIEPKAVKVSFLGKASSMGVLRETDVYSLGQKKLLKPAYTNSNKNVTHWVDHYFLFPARYLICYREISDTRERLENPWNDTGLNTGAAKDRHGVNIRLRFMQLNAAVAALDKILLQTLIL